MFSGQIKLTTGLQCIIVFEKFDICCSSFLLQKRNLSRNVDKCSCAPLLPQHIYVLGNLAWDGDGTSCY